MDEPANVVEVVMRREDGSSILDTPGGAGPGAGDVGEARARAIGAELERLGFTIESGNLNTLWVSGPDALFREVFGIEPRAAMAGVAAHGTRIPPGLEDMIAGVHVAPPPTFFP